MFVYVVLINDGFYMEPDVSIYCICSTTGKASRVVSSLKRHHKHVWFEKYLVK